jgi:hypothetical protein
LIASIFVYINIFIVLFFGAILMFANFKPDTFRKLIYGSIALIALPICVVGILNMMGVQSHRVDDLVFMHGGAVGLLVVIGYGLALGLALNKLRTTLFKRKSTVNDTEEER